jgi:uncharacterized membrane protein YdfJ with MMPL/SSD domain
MVVCLIGAAAFFSFRNSSERVVLDVGFTVLYRLSLVGLVFGSFLLGMITMFLFGFAWDRKIQRALRVQMPGLRKESLVTPVQPRTSDEAGVLSEESTHTRGSP